MKKFLLAAGLVLVVAAPAAAQVTGCWDILEFSDVDLAYSGPGAASLVVVPDGSGSPLTQAFDSSGQAVDAMVTMTLRDCIEVPIANFPREDMWLEAVDGGLYACPGGTIADANTDVNGVTRWTSPLSAGGFSQAGCVVMVNGMAHWKTLPLHFNSPDINHDGFVNLSDVAIFAGDFHGPYKYRADFRRDGVVNLSDVIWMAQALGDACP